MLMRHLRPTVRQNRQTSESGDSLAEDFGQVRTIKFTRAAQSASPSKLALVNFGLTS